MMEKDEKIARLLRVRFALVLFLCLCEGLRGESSEVFSRACVFGSVSISTAPAKVI